MLSDREMFSKQIMFKKPRVEKKNLRDPAKSDLPWMLRHRTCTLRNRGCLKNPQGPEFVYFMISLHVA